MSSDACCTKKETTAEYILSMLERLASRTVQLEEQMGHQLAPIMEPEPERCLREGKTDNVLPPYFDKLRGLCQRIDISIEHMEDLLRRTAI